MRGELRRVALGRLRSVAVAVLEAVGAAEAPAVGASRRVVEREHLALQAELAQRLLGQHDVLAHVLLEADFRQAGAARFAHHDAVTWRKQSGWCKFPRSFRNAAHEPD